MNKKIVKIVLLFLVVSMLAACNDAVGDSQFQDETSAQSQTLIDDNKTDNSESNKEGEDELSYTYRTGVYHNKEWSDDWGTYTAEAIPNVETAISIATALFKNAQSDGVGQNYVLNSVFFDTEDNIWIVTFSQSTDSSIDGGEFNIALDKSSGTVLRMWFAE